jgi:hypothetical protein
MGTAALKYGCACGMMKQALKMTVKKDDHVGRRQLLLTTCMILFGSLAIYK